MWSSIPSVNVHVMFHPLLCASFCVKTRKRARNLEILLKQDNCYTGITRDAVVDSFISNVCFADL